MGNIDWTWLVIGALIALFGLPFVVRFMQSRGSGA